jgi:hypothetical protein
VAAPLELVDEVEAEAAVGSGDDGDASGHVAEGTPGSTHGDIGPLRALDDGSTLRP